MEDNKENNYKNIFSKAIDIDTINLTKPLNNNAKWLHIYRNHKSSDHCCHFKWTKKEIFHWLEYPEKHEKELRNVSRHLYDTSPQYWRLINYFANMCPFQYVIYPFKFDKEKYISDKGKSFKAGYKKASNLLEIMNLQHELHKIKIINWKEDAFFGYIYQTKDSFHIRPLNPDYCLISGIYDGCYKYAFDFSYFNNKTQIELENFGSEFVEKYELYKLDNTKYRWQELEPKNEFCTKIADDIDYLRIPFASCFPAIYDIEDYKNIQKTASDIKNYKALGMRVPVDSDGKLLISQNVMDDFYQHILNILPPNVGLYMTPCDISEINFEINNDGIDVTSNSVKNFFNDAGVSSLIFGGDNQTSASLKISLVADEALAYALNKQIERNINKLLKLLSGTTKFQIKVLDVSYYHQKDTHDLYLKDAQYGIPTKSSIPSSIGLDSSILDSLTFMENEFLDLTDKYEPLKSSYTSSNTDDDNNGRPTNDDLGLDLTDSGEATLDKDVNQTYG